MALSKTTRPPDVLGNLPYIIICDFDRRIINSTEDLKPFSSITSILYNTSDLINELKQPDRQCVVVIISLLFTVQDVKNIVQKHLHPNSAVDSYYLLFHNGEEFIGPLSHHFGFRLKWCGSVSDQFLKTVLDACLTACSLRISFCLKRVQQCDYEGNTALANLFILERHKMMLLLNVYSTDCLQYTDLK